ncbi:hypothetical protein ATK17_3723 [Branchiibius hedensis]|uniref:Homeodomain-like domain-containing protein n=2 Tax=Branchiibius hedensis TaxID=672460 RepID=A0A2Y9BPM7_9MICO|nr:hypothetical protein ATK17_3991 [Branchiibius hedensis]PWJ27520.1 hypothetical protein ATK17_3723 [Branchiibius hedensis]SSA36330.1 hypothetical protein SAMN04489750_3723 [Branchiibius hedensis]SSA59170.1 hypothetical protein SAMN04489750_3991 [Branchiibius hedensis]
MGASDPARARRNGDPGQAVEECVVCGATWVHKPGTGRAKTCSEWCREELLEAAARRSSAEVARAKAARMRAAADLIARARAVKGDRRMVPVLVPRLRSAGLPYADIAEVLGVSVSTAWRVANRPPP